MRRIRCVVEYDGTAYVGWQTQPNGISVQETVEKALEKVTGDPVRIHGSGRTDSGVHARAQVFHFDTGVRMPASKFAIASNMFLPADIRILWSEEAPEDFHARFSAKEKTYRYTVQTGPHARVATRNTACHVHVPLDDAAMREAAALISGTHDFAAFKSAGVRTKTTVRTIFSSVWTRDGEYLYYDVTGNGFLYNMVRILTGTMLEIGKGLRPVSSVAAALESGRREDAGATAPAHGLTLMRVRYPDFDTDGILGRLRSDGT